jgi:two-component system chemotaxis sensor kinase CheA
MTERALIAYGVGVVIVGYMGLEWTRYAWLGPPVVGPGLQDVVRLAIIPTTFAMYLLAVFHFALSVRRSEHLLDERNRALRFVFDHVDQGLMTIEADGRLSSERSAVVDRWLGVRDGAASLVDVLAAHDPTFAASLALGLEAIADDALPIEVTLAQMPTRLRADGRVLDVSYKPIDGSNGRMLVVLTDATADVEREVALETEREVVALTTRALADRGIVRDSLAQTHALLARLTSGSSRRDGHDVVARDLHTLKGNAALFGLHSVARMCHALEDEWQERGRGAPLSAGPFEAIAARFEAIATPVRPLVVDASGPEVSFEEVARLRAAAASGASAAELCAEIDTWFGEPAERRLSLLAAQARELARRLDRGEIRTTVAAAGARVEGARWAPLWSSLAHVVRNAVDHGLEPPAERVALGKPRRSLIRLTARVDGPALVLEIADDGRGIDWDRVAQKARAAGLPTGSHDDLVAALFADGVSTRDLVTETSGRGVGLGAVRAAFSAAGARIAVESHPGAGTTFTFVVPTTRPGLRPPTDA